MIPHRRRRRKPQEPDTRGWTPAEILAHRNKQLQAKPVAELALPVRIINTLEENNVILVKDLLQQTYESLLGMKNFGATTFKEVRAAIKSLGLEPPASWTAPAPAPARKRRPSSGSGGNDLMKLW